MTDLVDFTAGGKQIRIHENVFWSKVEKTETCWLWMARLDKKGYGRHGDSRKAHRIAWTLLRGPIPEGMLLLHTCHVRHCVNPDHLYIGTAKDNARDMVEAGHFNRENFSRARQRWLNMTTEERRTALKNRIYPTGSAHPRAKLTEEQVTAIRAEYVPYRVGLKELAQKYGVSMGTIYSVVRGQTYQSAPNR